MKLFIFFISLFMISHIRIPVSSSELTLEEEIKEAFSEYPFKCNPEGSTPEMAACIWIDLIKSDRKLREELNNPDLFAKWLEVRNKICNHFQEKMYAGGTIKQLTRPSCGLRVNKEIQKYCITGDPTCG